MSVKLPQLRIRVVDPELGRSPDRRIEVLDASGTVLGDLSHSITNVTWKMGIGGVSVVRIEIAAQRTLIESISG